MANRQIHLIGRLILTGEIHALTGLRIGGSASALAIGGVDLPVIRNSMDQHPYIPGSSLKGKMRSLAEKATNAPLNRRIGQAWIHTAGGNGPRDYSDKEQYRKEGERQYTEYWVNPLFGVPGEVDFKISGPTRLVVRDVPLSPASVERLKTAKSDMLFTEIKTEVAIDRITSQATPRQVERVPAGAVFAPMELVLSYYAASDGNLTGHLLTCLQLVEDDYLGGHGSRGSGKIAFQELRVTWRSSADYTRADPYDSAGLSLADLNAKRADLADWVAKRLSPNGGA